MFTLIYHIYERPTDSKRLKRPITIVELFGFLLMVGLYTSQTELNLPTDVQASKHLMISNGGSDATSGKIQPLGVVSKVKIAKEANAESERAASVHHSVGELKIAQKLVHQEKQLAQSKLRKVLGQIIPHQYIVVLKDETNDPQLVANKAIGRGATVPFIYNNAIKGFAMTVPNKLVLNSILLNPEVNFVEPDIKVQAFSQISSTGYSRVGGLSSVNVPHSQTSINAGIAIIDTGIDLNHPDLNVYKQVSFVPGTSANDDNGHGTAVAGIAAAEDNSVGAVGVAPGARLWAVKVLDSTGTGSISTIIQGIDYVTQNAAQIDAANLSFGCKCTSSALNIAINNSVSAGVTYVVAAGNSGEDVSSWIPASNPNVISVAAIADSDGKCGGIGPPTTYGPDDSLASFSNFGSKVTIAAPGVNIYTTYIGSSYVTLSGTSMAAPFVTGAAALYHSLHPGTTTTQVRDALISAGSKPTTICDGHGHGYFKNTNGNEPLLYIGNDTNG